MKKIIYLLALLLISDICHAQIKTAGKAEVGYLNNRYLLVRVDPGPNWKGYNLDDDQNGMDINLAYGIKLKQKTYVYGGAGYLNFEGIGGLSVFAGADYVLLKKRLSPMLNFKGGYTHIWNQYAGGTGAGMIEPGAGLNFRINNKLQAYLQSGFLITQQTLFVPVRAGVRF